MGVSENRGPSYSTPKCRVPYYKEPQIRVPPIFGNPQMVILLDLFQKTFLNFVVAAMAAMSAIKEGLHG